MNSRVSDLQKRLYPDAGTRDAVGLFLRELEQNVRSCDVVLDIGAGAGELNAYSFKGRVRRMIGVDLDPRVESNPLLDEGIVADGETLPFPDKSIDVAFSIYVHEHVEKPASFAAEISRILAPGGRYLALTPNRFHYVTAIAALTPTRFHRWVNRRRGRSAEDTFPTFYRLNTAAALRRHFAGAGFEAVEVNAIEVEPQYLKFHPFAYLAGAGYERLVNSSHLFRGLRVNLILKCHKPSGFARSN